MTDPRYPTRRTVDPDIPLVHGKQGTEGDALRNTKQVLDTMLGRGGGDPRDQVVRVRDLVALGLAAVNTSPAIRGGLGGAGGPGGPTVGTPFLQPPRPGTNPRPTIFTNLRTTGLWNGIRIYWDYPPRPPSGAALEYAGVEVYGAEKTGAAIPTFANAGPIGSSSGAVNFFTHDLGPTGFAKTWYYWLRWLYITSSQFPIAFSQFTPGQDAPGLRGQSDVSPAQLVQALTNQIRQDSLTLGLANGIARGEIETAATQGIGTLSSRILAANVAGNSAIQQLASLRGQVGSVLSGSYSVRADLNGFVTGFGFTASYNPTGDLNPILPGNQTADSAFIIRANRFAIEVPAEPDLPGTSRYPFTVGQIINPDWLPPVDMPDLLPTIANGGLVDGVGINGRLAVRGTIHADVISAGTIRARHIDPISITTQVLSAESIITGSLSTAGDTNWRVFIGGANALFPLWYGIGTLGSTTEYDANGAAISGPVFFLDRFGNVSLAGNLTVTGFGRFSTAGGSSSARVEIGGNDGLLFWAGSGSRNRDNGALYFDTDGNIFVRGQPLQVPVGAGDGGQTAEITVVLPPGQNTALVAVLVHAVVGSPQANRNEKTFRSTITVDAAQADQTFISSADYTKGMSHMSVVPMSAGLHTVRYRCDITETSGGGSGGVGECTYYNTRFVLIQVTNIVQ